MAMVAENSKQFYFKRINFSSAETVPTGLAKRNREGDLKNKQTKKM